MDRRLVIYTVIASSIITLFLTVIQLASDYHSRVSESTKTLENIEKGSLSSLTKSAWDIDLANVDIVLEGILQK
jgi:hypothetical protein